MRIYQHGLKMVPDVSKLLSSVVSHQRILEQVVFGGEFGCELWTRPTHATGIARRLSYRKDFNNLDGTASYTLQSRFLEYFRTNSKYSRLNETTVPISVNENVLHKYDTLIEQLSALKPSQLAQCISDLHHQCYKPSLSENRFLVIISSLDEECCKRFKVMSPEQVLSVLDAWMHLLPHKITQLKIYHLFTQDVESWLTLLDIIPVEVFIKLIFYYGLAKKTKRPKVMGLCMNFIDKHIELQSLSMEELGIMVNAFYKTGTPIASPKLLASINDALIKNIDRLIEDPALFVTLVKPLRQAQNYDYKVLDIISNKMVSNVSTTQLLGFTAKSHILALYAGALYARCDILSLLIASSQRDLTVNQSHTSKISNHFSIHHRSKDITRFLWSVSFLNHTLEHAFIKSTIIPDLKNRFESGEYIKRPSDIIDSLLYLWMLDFKADSLLVDALQMSLQAQNKPESKRVNSRLALLLTCVSIEAPDILNAEVLALKRLNPGYSKPNISKSLANRPLLKNVYGIVSRLSEVLKITNIAIKYIIPHLHIAGIEVNIKSRTIYIEVLDPTVCLHKSEKPHGLMQLKLRLMKSQSYQVLNINHNEINLDNSSHLQEYIGGRLLLPSATIEK